MGRSTSNDKNVEGMKHILKALEIDPDWSEARALLAGAHYANHLANGRRYFLKMGLTNDMSSKAFGLYHLKKVKKKINNKYYIGAVISQRFANFLYDDETLKLLEQLIRTYPNDPSTYFVASRGFREYGRFADSEYYSNEWRKSEPDFLFNYHTQLAGTFLAANKLEEFVQIYIETGKYLPSRWGFYYPLLASALGNLGRVEEIDSQWLELQKKYFTVRGHSGVENLYTANNSPYKKRYLEGLIKAGVPGNLTDARIVDLESRLNSEEIKSLLFNKTKILYWGAPKYKSPLYHFRKDKIALRTGVYYERRVKIYQPKSYKTAGDYFVENDQLCLKYHPDYMKTYLDEPICGYVYRAKNFREFIPNEHLWVHPGVLLSLIDLREEEVAAARKK